MREITYAEAIREATAKAMREDKNVIVIGEGVPDPKAIFGTTKGLREEFGPDRVFDMPVSENGVTGVCIGAATQGLKPIMVHQRIDFTLYAFDQIVNNAAKWHSMFGGKAGNVPLVIRAIIGRGWGQGNQHSQNLAHLYAMIPGLKVVVPSNARDAHDLLLWAINEPNPVMFIEHRWLHNTSSYLNPPSIAIDKEVKARYVTEGNHLTLVAWSYMVVEALKAQRFIKEYTDIQLEIIDMRSLRPLDIGAVKYSVKKTKRLLVLEEAWRFNGLASEIISEIAEDDDVPLFAAPRRITLPDCYAPSTPALTKHYYPTTIDIVHTILDMMGKDKKQYQRLFEALALDELSKQHDVPDSSFKGPF